MNFRNSGLPPGGTGEGILLGGSCAASKSHSSRRTRIGSTDAARRAGSHAANGEQASRTATAPLIATPSNGFTLKSKLDSNLAKATDRIKPAPIPVPVNVRAERSV